MKTKCELLAPAGGMKQLIAAVENGADAVYMGGHSFNARINADNFTAEEMKRAIEYAHIRDVKVYITVNTLFKDEELEAGLQYAGELYEMGADALIIQDIGFGSIARAALPDFPLHLSTQASIYNVRGIKKAAELGYERVVPARELSLEEIRQASDTGTDIEVFVHGAMCFCYSGQCQMSRIIGGRSGNRGLCAQPCRLRYSLDGREGYYLSPKDMCTVDRLGEFAEAGVSSFKIEGRMKSAEYVAQVTAIYRKYLNMYYETGSITVDEADRRALEQIFNRGGFTQGYLDKNPGREFLSGDIPKHRGVYIGRVLEKNGQIVRIKTNEDIANGDGIEIHGREITGNIVTYIKEAGRGKLDIGDFKGYVSKGADVYRTSSSAQLKALRKTFEEGRFLRKVPVSFTFTAEYGSYPKLLAEDGDFKAEITGDAVCERAVNRPLDEDTVRKQLGKTGNTPFEAAETECSIESDISVPVSAINAMRRHALEALQEIKGRGRAKGEISMPELPAGEKTEMTGIYVTDIKGIEGREFAGLLQQYDGRLSIFLPLISYMKNRESIDEKLGDNYQVIPYISNISKGREDEYIESNIDSICEAVRANGIMIGNLCWIEVFVSRGIAVYGGYGLNVYNRYTDALLKKLGVAASALSLESLEKGEGNLPLMVSEHIIRGRSLTDRKGETYRVIRNDAGDKSVILSKGRVKMPDKRSSEYINCVYI